MSLCMPIKTIVYKKKNVVHGVKFVLVSVDITFEIVYNTHVTINKLITSLLIVLYHIRNDHFTKNFQFNTI